MTIEFFCDECYTQVLAPDSQANKMGKCPKCGKLLQIPDNKMQVAEATVVQEPQQTQLDVLEEVLPSREAFSDEHLKSRYGINQEKRRRGWSANAGWERAERTTKERLHSRKNLNGPASSLLMLGIIGMATVGVSILAVVVIFVLASIEAEMVNDFRNLPWLMISMVLCCEAMVYMMIIIGANNMKQARSYNAALLGAIIAVLPIQPLLFFTMPVGFWAFSCLTRLDVKRGFLR